MTIAATRPAPTRVADTPGRRWYRWDRREGWVLLTLLTGTAVLYVWNLGAAGWANSFYAAAVQAGSRSWTALLFGSSDAANAITVDKTPAALWVMGLSARLFGFNAWSMLVPQALMGVAAVGVLYAAVRRVAGPGAALLSGVVLALVDAAYFVLRALERSSSPWWFAWAGLALGVGFLAKMLQAFLVLPVFALVFLVCADLPWRNRLLRSLGGAAAVAGLCIAGRAPRTDPVRAALLLWGGWLVVTAVTFSYMNGIVHPYYTVALAPAMAAVLGIGTQLLWQRRVDIRAATTLAGMLLISVTLSFVLLQVNSTGMPWLRWTVLVVGTAAGLLLPVVGRWTGPAAAALAVVAVVAALAGPTAYSVVTAATPQHGAIPSAGPRAGFGGPPGFLDASRPTTELTALLNEHAADYTWVAAAVGSNNAAGYQLATGATVMAVGGFNGTDPAPTLAQFQADVAAGRIHYFVGGEMMRPRGGVSGSDAAQQIANWVQTNFAGQTVGSGSHGSTVYDLSE